MLNKSRRRGSAGRANGVRSPQAIPVQLLGGYTELSSTSRRHKLEGSWRWNLKSFGNRCLRISLFESVGVYVSLSGLSSLSPAMSP